jgi:hypothetical protein
VRRVVEGAEAHKVHNAAKLDGTVDAKERVGTAAEMDGGAVKRRREAGAPILLRRCARA